MTARLYFTFTEKPDKSPDEVTAVMTEGGFGKGHFPKAVSRSVDLVLCPGARRLLCLFPPGMGAFTGTGVLKTTANVICHCENNCCSLSLQKRLRYGQI